MTAAPDSQLATLWCPSPNREPRRDGRQPDMLLLHYTGMEIHNPGHDLDYRDFPETQMRAVIALCGDILGRHAIPAYRVLAHSDIAPGRKRDPGEKFDWRMLAEA